MTNRVKESDLILPALRVMSEQPSGFISTTNLITQLEHIFQPQGQDAAILEGRNDNHFSQKVRNLISHKTSHSNFIYKGYASHIPDREGLEITQKGRALLAEIASD